MPDDGGLTTTTAAPRAIRVGGEVHEVHPLTLDDWGKMQTWVDAQFPDPFDAVNEAIAKGRLVVRDGKPAREPYTTTQQQFLLRLASEQTSRGRRLIGTPEADEKLTGMEGVKALLTLSIRKGEPGFTDADADRLYSQMTLVDVGRVFSETQADLVLSDPKAAPGTTTPAGPTSP